MVCPLGNEGCVSGGTLKSFGSGRAMGVFQSERHYICKYEDKREDKRFFAETGEVERDRDQRHEGDAASERDPPE